MYQVHIPYAMDKLNDDVHYYTHNYSQAPIIVLAYYHTHTHFISDKKPNATKISLVIA